MYVCNESDYFRIQGILSFLLFLDTFRIQSRDVVVSLVLDIDKRHKINLKRQR